jgi:hypothetical protein
VLSNKCTSGSPYVQHDNQRAAVVSITLNSVTLFGWNYFSIIKCFLNSTSFYFMWFITWLTCNVLGDPLFRKYEPSQLEIRGILEKHVCRVINVYVKAGLLRKYAVESRDMKRVNLKETFLPCERTCSVVGLADWASAAYQHRQLSVIIQRWQCSMNL